MLVFLGFCAAGRVRGTQVPHAQANCYTHRSLQRGFQPGGPFRPVRVRLHQADRELVLAAVQQDGAALAFASEELREEKEVRLGPDGAIQQKGQVVGLCSWQVRSTTRKRERDRLILVFRCLSYFSRSWSVRCRGLGTPGAEALNGGIERCKFHIDAHSQAPKWNS